MKEKDKITIVAIEQIEGAIFEIRGQRVMLDIDLADIYGISVKRLNEQVKRQAARFPKDFLFQLSLQEFRDLRSQFATAKWNKRRSPPYAFTEHGAIMAATILSSPAAVDMSVHVVRAFIKSRRFIEQHNDLTDELKKLKESLSAKFGQYDEQFRVVFETINQLIGPLEEKKKRRIGFERIKKG